MKYYIQFTVAVIFAGAVALIVIPMATNERGFTGAVGGEWLVIILAGAIGHAIGSAVYKLLWR